MTRTERNRINRYKKLLATLKRTLELIESDEYADWSTTRKHTVENIRRVESLLGIRFNA